MSPFGLLFENLGSLNNLGTLIMCQKFFRLVINEFLVLSIVFCLKTAQRCIKVKIARIILLICSVIGIKGIIFFNVFFESI